MIAETGALIPGQVIWVAMWWRGHGESRCSKLSPNKLSIGKSIECLLLVKFSTGYCHLDCSSASPFPRPGVVRTEVAHRIN
jgi:hypothetical protein